MVIANNISSNTILGEQHKNTKKKTKASSELALGEKIKSAGDDASSFAISEKMRVRIRALGQDEDNVKKGASMLRVAEGAIQSQINLLRTIKEKVIDAHNDTNADTDRMIIQKEIDQYYQEIDDISVETVFNKRILLRGNAVDDVVESWRVLDHPILVEGSDSLDMIPNAFDTLDTKVGPFDTFGKEIGPDSKEQIDWDGYWQLTIKDATTIKGHDPNARDDLHVSGSKKTLYHDGSPNDPNKVEIDLSKYTFSSSDKTSLDNVSFQDPNGHVYVLTTDTSRHYNSYTYETIDISSCSSTADVAGAIATAISRWNVFSGTNDGSTVKLTTKDKGVSTNSHSISGTTLYGGAKTSSPIGTNRTGAGKTGLASVNPVTFTGGSDGVRQRKEIKTKDPNNPDLTKITYEYYWDPEPTSAKATITGVNGVDSGTGITLNLDRTYYLAFVDGDSKLKSDTGRYTIGKNYNGTFSLGDCSCTMRDGTITITAPKSLGTRGRGYGGSDGITASTVIPGETIPNYYTGTKALEQDCVTNKRVGKDGDRAYWEFDATAYTSVDDAINSLVGKAFRPASGNVYEFVNLDAQPSMDSIQQYAGSPQIDLGRLKALMKTEGTLPKAFAALITRYVPRSEATEKGVKFNATVPGEEGNSNGMTFYEGHLRQYTINFQEIFKNKGITNIPEALDDKGFRFYCATDASEWVNVHFVNGIDPNMDSRPQSGTDDDKIRTVMIDVSGITSVEDLIKTIYEGNDKNPQGLAECLKDVYKHNFLAAADYKKGTLTIYDKRQDYVMDKKRDPATHTSGYEYLREHGAKIADGVMDNVVKDKRYVRVNRLIIHHTDKSSRNIKVDIPQTSMDHVFGFVPANKGISEYNVMTSKMREELLGTDGPPKVEGYLDKGLQYLIDANTLIGAQIVHTENAEANIVTDSENTTAAESVIRDADMAKSAMTLAISQILSQSAQAMLSQSNQNSSSALSLLQ